METTKRVWSYVLLFMMTVCSLSLVSCSSDDDDDDDGGDVAPAAFEAYAAKYQIADAGAAFSSVEFTESGNYIMVLNDLPTTGAKSLSSLAAKKSPAHMMFGNLLRKAATRSESVYSPILYGKYTVDADGTYVLAGYGKVKVVENGAGNAYSLEFMPSSGSSFTYTASKQNRDLDSENTNRLCRTWNTASFQIVAKINGKVLLDVTASTMGELIKKLQKWAESNDEEFDPSDWEYLDIANPEQVVFTKTGTYMVKYSNSELAVSTWRWVNDSETMLQYSWENDFEDSYLNGFASVSYKGRQLVITETDKEEEDGESYEMSMVYYFNEVK